MNEHKRVSPEINFAKANIYNFLNGFGGPVWGAFAAYYGPLMALLGFLQASSFYNGVVNALFWLGFILTQVPAAYFSERLRIKKWAMGIIFICSGLFLLVYCMVLMFTGGGNFTLMLVLFIICYAGTTITWGASAPLVFTFLFKIIPQNKLGSWLGIYFMLASIGGLLGGGVVKRILEYGYPVAFEILFACAFGFSIAMAVAVWLVDEPEGELAPRMENFGVYIKHIITIIREDKNLVRFFIGMWIAVGHYIALTFYSTYMTTGEFGIDKAQTGLFVTMNFLGWILASLGPIFVILYPLGLLMKLFGSELKVAPNIFSAGWIADRFGPKHTLIVFQVVAFIGVLLALIAHNIYAFYAVWVFAGFAQICNNIGYSNMTLLSCTIQDKSSYIGLVNFAVFPFAVVVPMIVGALIGRNIMSFTLAFKLSMVLMVITALYFLIFVDNPIEYKKMKESQAS
ncbi:MFS transporter [bacterium]|nr:MFS transporter [bacterium]